MVLRDFRGTCAVLPSTDKGVSGTNTMVSGRIRTNPLIVCNGREPSRRRQDATAGRVSLRSTHTAKSNTIFHLGSTKCAKNPIFFKKKIGRLSLNAYKDAAKSNALDDVCRLTRTSRTTTGTSRLWAYALAVRCAVLRLAMTHFPMAVLCGTEIGYGATKRVWRYYHAVLSQGVVLLLCATELGYCGTEIGHCTTRKTAMDAALAMGNHALVEDYRLAHLVYGTED
eukprot:237504-Rhodomonas_salina.1